MNSIIAWFKSKSISSHTVMVVLLALAGLVTTDAQVQELLKQLLAAHPAIMADITLVAGIILKYSHSTPQP